MNVYLLLSYGFHAGLKVNIAIINNKTDIKVDANINSNPKLFDI